MNLLTLSCTAARFPNHKFAAVLSLVCFWMGSSALKSGKDTGRESREGLIPRRVLRCRASRRATAISRPFRMTATIPVVTLNHDTFSATLSQGWAVGVSASGGKGAFFATAESPTPAPCAGGAEWLWLCLQSPHESPVILESEVPNLRRRRRRSLHPAYGSHHSQGPSTTVAVSSW